jgi:beta-lactam-binding protein with PASTA domain
VPNVLGLTKSQAQQILLDNKLKVGKLIFPDDAVSEVAKVTKQTPEALIEVSEDTAVDLYFTDQGVPFGNTGSTTGGQNTQSARSTVHSPLINLNNAVIYGNSIKVQVEITPSDTGKTEVFINETKSKESFPIQFGVPVPANGRTRVRVLLDGVFYTEFYLPG